MSEAAGEGEEEEFDFAGQFVSSPLPLAFFVGFKSIHHNRLVNLRLYQIPEGGSMRNLF